MNNEKENHNSKEDIRYRMDGFDKVKRSKEIDNETSKSARLPYGFKRYMTCPACGNIIEIENLNEKMATYICKTCNKTTQVKCN